MLILEMMECSFDIAIFSTIRVFEDQNLDFDLKEMEFGLNGVEIVEFGVDLSKSAQIQRFRPHFDFEDGIMYCIL